MGERCRGVWRGRLVTKLGELVKERKVDVDACRLEAEDDGGSETTALCCRWRLARTGRV